MCQPFSYFVENNNYGLIVHARHTNRYTKLVLHYLRNDS